MSDSDSEDNLNLKRRKTKSSDQEDSNDDVEAEFLFNDPNPDDFENVLTLLQGYMKEFEWQLPDSVKKDKYSYLSELVSNQPNIGTVVKVDDPDEPYIMAVLSLLNLNQYEGLNSFKDSVLKNAEKHCDKDQFKKLKDVLSDNNKQVGLLINERMGNLPSELVGKLQECVKEDVKWSKENVDDEDEKKFYEFTHVLGLSRLYKDKSKDTKNDSNLVFHKPEEKFYYDNSFVKYMLPTGESNKVNFYEENNKKSSSKILPEYLFIYCLNFDKYNYVVKEILKNFKE